jgi:hypothetical protein
VVEVAVPTLVLDKVSMLLLVVVDIILVVKVAVVQKVLW